MHILLCWQGHSRKQTQARIPSIHLRKISVYGFIIFSIRLALRLLKSNLTWNH